LLLRNPAGQLTPLGALAEIGPGNGRSVIVHEGARRRQQVGCNVQGRDLASFLKEAKQRLTHQVRLPPGVYAAFAGSGETQRQAQAELLWNAALAALGVLLLLRMVLANWRHVGLVLLNLPFALVGGVVAIAITGGVLSLGSLVGFVTLFGISMRNSLMIVAHYQHLVEQEGCVWDLETAIRGASERLAPVLMTALVTGLGLLPLALGSGDPGREIEGPMATVILGGLLTSTGLNLLLLPIGAWRFARFTHLASATSAPG
jgi:Cu/Ag efflux pump CusA